MTPTRPSELAVNEAAERLHHQLCAFSEGDCKLPFLRAECSVQELIDAALATERRNTVERIRASVEARGTTAIFAILDEVAS